MENEMILKQLLQASTLILGRDDAASDRDHL